MQKDNITDTHQSLEDMKKACGYYKDAALKPENIIGMAAMISSDNL